MDKLSFVIVGHVDHGKSTLIGRILYDTDSLPEDRILELKKASKGSRHELEFAFLLDHLKEEREQGITIDTTQTFFRYNDRQYIIIDAPGHVEFVKNMVTGASQADASVLIVDAEEGIREQTIRHSYILSMLGMKKVIVVVNKMDRVAYREDRYLSLTKDITKVLEELDVDSIECIPASAITGDNVCSKSRNMEWYHGKTVLETLETHGGDGVSKEEASVFAVQDVYKIEDKRLIVGKIERGTLRRGQDIEILPGGERSVITELEKFNEECFECEKGDSLGLTLKDPLFTERGNLLCSFPNKIKNTNRFRASIFWMEKKPLRTGAKLLIRCVTQETQVEVISINKVIQTNTIHQDTVQTDCLNNLNAGEVVLSAKKGLSVSCFKDIQELGRFVLVLDNNICAGGIITDVMDMKE